MEKAEEWTQGIQVPIFAQISQSEHKSETDPLLQNQSVKALKRKDITFDIGFEELGLVLKGYLILRFYLSKF